MAEDNPMLEMDQDTFNKQLDAAVRQRHKSALRTGPSYNDPESAPLVWHDQVWQRGLTPSGIVNCEHALRVGSTQNALDVLLVGAHDNSGRVMAASGATVTLICLQADTEDGVYEAVGASHCITAPAEGISAEPDHLFCRLAIGNFRKPWLKIRLEFAGSISGGKLDAVLSYAAR